MLTLLTCNATALYLWLFCHSTMMKKHSSQANLIFDWMKIAQTWRKLAQKCTCFIQHIVISFFVRFITKKQISFFYGIKMMDFFSLQIIINQLNCIKQFRQKKIFCLYRVNRSDFDTAELNDFMYTFIV